jgi:hypothetical protein
VRVISNPQGLRAAQGLSVPEHVPAEHGVGNGGNRVNLSPDGKGAGYDVDVSSFSPKDRDRLNLRLARWRANKEYDMMKQHDTQGHEMAKGLQARQGEMQRHLMERRLQAGAKGSETLDGLIANNINAMVPNKDGTGFVKDPRAAAELQRFIDSQNGVVRTSEGDMSLPEALQLHPGDGRQSVATTGGQFGLWKAADKYGRNSSSPRSPADGKLQVEGPARPITMSDMTQGGVHVTDWLKSFLPGVYANGLPIKSSNGQRVVLPMSEVANHPDQANVMAAVNEAIAEAEAAKKHAKQTN